MAELTGLNTRTGTWIKGLRLICRRTKPARRHTNKLTELEKRTGWRYAIVATNIDRMRDVPGSHQPQWIDALHRDHAVVEDRIRASKAMGLANLPSQSWKVNRGWVVAANIAADLAAWTRLLGLHDHPDLAAAEPETLRYRLLHLPAKLTTHARQRHLTIHDTWPWARGIHHLLAAPDRHPPTGLTSTNHPNEPERINPGAGRPGAPVAAGGDATPNHRGQNGHDRTRHPGPKPTDESRLTRRGWVKMCPSGISWPGCPRRQAATR